MGGSDVSREKKEGFTSDADFYLFDRATVAREISSRLCVAGTTARYILAIGIKR